MRGGPGGPRFLAIRTRAAPVAIMKAVIHDEPHEGTPFDDTANQGEVTSGGPQIGPRWQVLIVSIDHENGNVRVRSIDRLDSPVSLDIEGTRKLPKPLDNTRGWGARPLYPASHGAPRYAKQRSRVRLREPGRGQQDGEHRAGI
jgi:hypothetical protein